MLKRVFEVIVAPLDWCWPLPLGILFGAFVVGVSAGAWWIFRAPTAPVPPPVQRNTAPAAQSPAHSEALPSPSEPAPSLPMEQTVPAAAQSSETTKAPPASASQPQPAAAIPQSGKTRQESVTKVPVQVTRPLTPQEVKLRDTLIRARWYMKHAQYAVAIEEFEAALEMDPSNREARSGLQQARDAGGAPKPNP